MFRRDLIIGILCSLLLHVGLGWGGELKFNWGKKARVVVKDDTPSIQIEMPKLEPEAPPPADSDSAASANEASSLAPPSVADVPGVVDVNSFVQPVSPPPPPSSGVAMSVPKSSVLAATASMTQVFDLKNLDQQPAPTVRAQPVYPFDMKRQAISALVVVEFICDNTGEVREARVVKSSNTAFDSAALEAIYKWKFRPGKKGGRAVNARMQQPFDFSIIE